jgi:hypothetical protein
VVCWGRHRGLDGLTGYELVQAAKKSLLDDFLRAILEGHRD